VIHSPHVVMAADARGVDWLCAFSNSRHREELG